MLGRKLSVSDRKNNWSSMRGTVLGGAKGVLIRRLFFVVVVLFFFWGGGASPKVSLVSKLGQ